MTIGARFVHTNIIAKNWRTLAAFYQEVFGCVPVPPERDLSEKWVEEFTGLPGARIQGVHLRLPGYRDGGPTLEIFQYYPAQTRMRSVPNRPGLRHLAFVVDDVAAAQEAVLSAGGSLVGDRVSADIPGAGTITMVYVTDPEGNIIELQHWS